MYIYISYSYSYFTVKIKKNTGELPKGPRCNCHSPTTSLRSSKWGAPIEPLQPEGIGGSWLYRCR